jgi:two-component system sensor histidine kinase YesM
LSERGVLKQLIFMGKNLKSYFIEAMTLKRRIIILMLLSSLLPFVFVGLISYHTIYSILSNKIIDGIHSNLKQIELSLNNELSNLNHVSQQLSSQGSIGKKLDELMFTDDPFQKVELTYQIKSELNVITLTNPSVGLTLYYFEDDGLISFENLPVRKDFNPKNSPVLAKHYGITYYGPHTSNYRFDDHYVLSTLRKVQFSNRDDGYVYIEGGFKLTQNILDNGHIGQNASFLFLDTNGKIVFSQIPDVFPVNETFVDPISGGLNGTKGGHYWFHETSKQGWTIVAVISKTDYNKEINRWFFNIILFSMIFFGTSLFSAWLLWKMVYRPLKNFNKEITMLANNDVRSVTTRTNIAEFDYLLEKFTNMKKQIWDLFAEIEKKEKRRVDLEVEKLLYQINPHFLMNTLDTVHWLAVMNGQSEIDRLIQSLNKLLYYNLGKLGQFSTVGEEVDAVKQYLTLQQIRYDFMFNVQIDVDEKVLQMPIPRFIIQPLVENSLYHGMNDNGCVQVHVSLENQRLNITIHDNGSGMSEETIERLLNNEQPEHKKVGMGIGLNYVKRMIEVQYNGLAELKIQSKQGRGTSIYLSLPIMEVEPCD